MTPVILLLAVAQSLGGGAARIKTIDRQCGSPGGAADRARARVGGLRVFADVSTAVLPRSREGDWREFQTEAELRAFAENTRPPNTEAVVARERDGTTLVSMYFQSEAGDWAHVVDYCFAPSGALRRMAGTFNSYKATARTAIRRRRTAYFDDAGAILAARTRVFDLDTDKPLPDVTFTNENDPVYPAVRALPFSSMLPSPSDAGEAAVSPVTRAVRERLPAVKACYDKIARRTPTLAGKAVARWTVDAVGSVTEFAWDSDDIGSADFSACARRVIEAWKFPPPDRAPVTVSFPFVFESHAQDLTEADQTPRSGIGAR